MVGTSVSSRNVPAFDGEKVGQKEGCGPSGGEVRSSACPLVAGCSTAGEPPPCLPPPALISSSAEALFFYSSIPPLLPSAPVKLLSPSPSASATLGSLGC